MSISRLMLPDAGSSWLKDFLNRDDGHTFPGVPSFKAQNCSFLHCSFFRSEVQEVQPTILLQ